MLGRGEVDGASGAPPRDCRMAVSRSVTSARPMRWAMQRLPRGAEPFGAGVVAVGGMAHGADLPLRRLG
ncbi:hypothetical protein I552_5090 [Mycobacterium xenopi 3993]|nr:hypothetical protein I552_5090 [Mycobacterium xenopi 3993]